MYQAVRWTLMGLAAAALFAAPAHAQTKLEKADPALAKHGEHLFAAKGCVACHTIGKGTLVGPDLKGVTDRRTLAWLTAYIKQPSSMLNSDSTAKALLKDANGVPMPDLGLKDDEVEALIHYLKQAGGS